MQQTRAKRRKHHIIYKTTCIITDRWYIGCHSTDDLNDGYMGSGSLLWKSIKRHGKQNHRTEILEHCPDRTSLIKREAEIVTEALLAQKACMNLIPGGSAGPEFKKPTPEETRAKISANSKAMWAKRKANPVAMAEHIKKTITPGSIAKRAAKNTGKKRSADQIANLAKGQQGYYSSADKEVLNERGQRAAITRAERGTSKGGRPKGIPMSELEKKKLGERMKANQVLNTRASCVLCRKETSVVALNRAYRGHQCNLKTYEASPSFRK